MSRAHERTTTGKKAEKGHKASDASIRFVAMVFERWDEGWAVKWAWRRHVPPPLKPRQPMRTKEEPTPGNQNEHLKKHPMSCA